MANKVRDRKVFHRKRSGSGGWRSGRGARAWRGEGGSDGTSDEDYVVGEEEEEDWSFYCSYSSDASLEDTESTSCAEEEEDEEEEEYDVSEYDEAGTTRGRRPRKTPALTDLGRRSTAKRSRRRRSRVPWLVEEAVEVEEAMEASLVRKPRAGPRRRSRVSDEGEEDEYGDEDDEEFVPEDGDDDDEYLASSPLRKTGGRRHAPLKRQGRRSRPRVSKKEEKRKKKAPVKRRRRRASNSYDDDFVVDDAVLAEGTKTKRKRSSNGRKRRAKRQKVVAPVSDDDDFVPEDWVLVERTNGKERKKKTVSNGKRRRSWMTHSDALDSDFDFTISKEELRDLQVGGPLGSRRPKNLSPAGKGEETGRGKENDDLGKQVCGICLSEDQKGNIRGLLDCCAHYFCFACIMEWSKVESRCPLCKQRFKTVSQPTVSGAGSNPRAVVKRVPKRDQVYRPSEEEMRNYLDPYANVVCMECQHGGDDHLMLLCDICDSSAHTYCVGLGREVPEGNWYCDGCRSMDPGLSNTGIHECVVEQGTWTSDLVQNTCGDTEPENATNYMPHETPQGSANLMSPQQSHSGFRQHASSGYHSLLGDHGSPLSASGFAASTLSGRRSIHQRIQIMLSDNRTRWMRGGVARNVVVQPSHVESDICSSEVGQPGEPLHVHRESPVNGVNGSTNRSILTPRPNMHPCTHSEASSFSMVEDTKAQVKSMVNNRLRHTTRDNPLIERRDFEDIAKRATHTILAACGLQHRGSMVSMPVGPPPNCVHLDAGELSGPIKGCCSLCFASFVGSVVQRLVDLKLLAM